MSASVGTLHSANWPNDAPCRGSSQWSSPCEGTTRKSDLESGMCRRGQAGEQRRAGCEDDCFVERQSLTADLMTQVLSHARKFTCAVVLNVRGFGEVFPPPVARKGIAIACKRHTLHFSKKKKTVHPNSMLTTICLIVATMTKTSLIMEERDTSPSIFRVNSFCSFTES